MISVLALILMIFNPGDDIVIKDQWMRPGAEKMGTALYFAVENKGEEADTLYSVVSGVSDMIQIHETYSSGDLMGMREIEQIIIVPGEKIKLEPGGKHIMVMKLKKDIKISSPVEFILHFKKAGTIKITASAK
jgi:copper(I)-binding protein